MTPARIPPPTPDDIPSPIASPRTPPEAAIELTEEFEEDTPTHVEPRRCPGCAEAFIEINGDGWIPVTYEQAWGGPYAGACRGSIDPAGPWWCKAPAEPLASGVDGRLVVPWKMEVRFFPDRRKQVLPVLVDRRRR